jgi:hypothetical protein
MMQTKLVALVAISLLVGCPPAYAVTVSTNAGTTESLDPHLSSPQASIGTGVPATLTCTQAWGRYGGDDDRLYRVHGCGGRLSRHTQCAVG